MKELCSVNGRKVFGEVRLPSTGKPAPLVIFSHELGQNHASLEPYAKRLRDAGFAVCIFDFCGGSIPGKENFSDPLAEMTVLTETDELSALIAASKGFEGVDPEKIVLCGASQGGLVTALAAHRCRESVAALLLLYPAFCINYDMRKRFVSPDNIPDEFEMWGGWMTLSGQYLRDIWDIDIYSMIPEMDMPVLLLHGSKDNIVDHSYAVRASGIFPDCEFHTIKGAGHSFMGEPFPEAVEYMEEFLKSRIGC